MKLDIFHINTFASEIFQGNPAAVCVLTHWLPPEIMQAIAAELNLSETVFVLRREEGEYRARCFSPKTELELGSHAILGAAFVLYHYHHHTRIPIRFQSNERQLITFVEDDKISFDFPLHESAPIQVTTDMAEAIGCVPTEAYAADQLILILDDPSQVKILEPDMAKILQLPYRGVCITARDDGSPYDFVSRYFSPQTGVVEDPVTASIYGKLALIYALKFGKTDFLARQVSARGGEIDISLQGDRVFLTGEAVTAMTSVMELPGL